MKGDEELSDLMKSIEKEDAMIVNISQIIPGFGLLFNQLAKCENINSSIIYGKPLVVKGLFYAYHLAGIVAGSYVASVILE